MIGNCSPPQTRHPPHQTPPTTTAPREASTASTAPKMPSQSTPLPADIKRARIEALRSRICTVLYGAQLEKQAEQIDSLIEITKENPNDYSKINLEHLRECRGLPTNFASFRTAAIMSLSSVALVASLIRMLPKPEDNKSTDHNPFGQLAGTLPAFAINFFVEKSLDGRRPPSSTTEPTPEQKKFFNAVATQVIALITQKPVPVSQEIIINAIHQIKDKKLSLETIAQRFAQAVLYIAAGYGIDKFLTDIDNPTAPRAQDVREKCLINCAISELVKCHKIPENEAQHLTEEQKKFLAHPFIFSAVTSYVLNEQHRPSTMFPLSEIMPYTSVLKHLDAIPEATKTDALKNSKNTLEMLKKLDALLPLLEKDDLSDNGVLITDPIFEALFKQEPNLGSRHVPYLNAQAIAFLIASNTLTLEDFKNNSSTAANRLPPYSFAWIYPYLPQLCDGKITAKAVIEAKTSKKPIPQDNSTIQGRDRLQISLALNKIDKNKMIMVVSSMVENYKKSMQKFWKLSLFHSAGITWVEKINIKNMDHNTALTLAKEILYDHCKINPKTGVLETDNDRAKHLMSALQQNKLITDGKLGGFLVDACNDSAKSAQPRPPI